MTELSAEPRSADDDRFDIALAGGGVAGLALALALRKGPTPRPSVVLYDPALAGTAPPPTLRAVAVTAASIRLLERLDVWVDLAADSHPMTAIVLTDAPATAVPKPVFLTLSGPLATDEPFAAMVLLDGLHARLLAAARAAGVVLRGVSLIEATARTGEIALVDRAGGQARARLLVAADGSRSRLRERAGIPSFGHDYDQSAIIATLAHDRDHEGRAVQHFSPGGPLALLPLRAADGTGRRTSIVWTEPSAAAARLAALDPAAFEAALHARIGYGRGVLRLEDRPSLHPLKLRLTRRLTGDRLALLGDAARTIHPLAGQGLNLGLGDAAVLAGAVGEAMRLGLDPGAPLVLTHYERARRPAQAAMALATDLINSLFRADHAPVRAMRDIGLGLIDRSPDLRRFFMWYAAGAPDEIENAADPRR